MSGLPAVRSEQPQAAARDSVPALMRARERCVTGSARDSTPKVWSGTRGLPALRAIETASFERTQHRGEPHKAKEHDRREPGEHPWAEQPGVDADTANPPASPLLAAPESTQRVDMSEVSRRVRRPSRTRRVRPAPAARSRAGGRVRSGASRSQPFRQIDHQHQNAILLPGSAVRWVAPALPLPSARMSTRENPR